MKFFWNVFILLGSLITGWKDKWENTGFTWIRYYQLFHVPYLPLQITQFLENKIFRMSLICLFIRLFAAEREKHWISWGAIRCFLGSVFFSRLSLQHPFKFWCSCETCFWTSFPFDRTFARSTWRFTVLATSLWRSTFIPWSVSVPACPAAA